mgnify:FL=1
MDTISIILVILLGLSCGSFINAWIYRTEKKESLLGRSHCPTCNIELSWRDNIPVISFIVLKKQCRHCKKSISWQYPIIELWTMFAFIYTFVTHDLQFTPELVRDGYIVILLTFIFVYDLKYQYILDKITLPAISILIVVNLIFSWMSPTNMLISIAVGGGFFLLQYVVSKGRWIGGGDIRLGVLMGVILGWPYVIVGIFLAYIIGLITVTPLLLARKKHMGEQIPFGTYLSVATLICMFHGEYLLTTYLSLWTF